MCDYIKREDAERLLRYDFLSALTEDERVDELNRVPSADVVEVKHGFWKYICNSSLGLKICECSVCHKRTYGSLKYCANCGAKMDGGEK